MGQLRVHAIVAAGACVAAAVPGVLIGIGLNERFDVYVVDDDLAARPGEQVLGLYGVGVLCTLLLVAVIGAFVARPGYAVVVARSTVISTVVGGIAAVTVGVAVAASTGFRHDPEVYDMVTAISTSTFFIVVTVVLARLTRRPRARPMAGG